MTTPDIGEVNEEALAKPKRKYTRRPKVESHFEGDLGPAGPKEVLAEAEASLALSLQAVGVPTDKSMPVPNTDWTPSREDFINLKGKLYLPARRRVQWMRGNPVPHPEWTIDTEIVDHERGKRTSPSRVDGGYAVVRANIYDETGRLIATGLKSEYSENFSDYLEKAETGAIARALAIAGYGTESALDLDEGAEAGRIADSPVAPTVTGSSVAGVGRGGHVGAANEPQIREVARLSRELGLAAEVILDIAATYTSVPTPELPSDPALQGPVMRRMFESMSGEEIGKVVTALKTLAVETGLEEKE
jgi:hypothetical protein